MNAELHLSAAGHLLVRAGRRWGALTRSGPHDTLCEAAIRGASQQRPPSQPVDNHDGELVGYLDTARGVVRVVPGRLRAVEQAWGAPLDRRQLEHVALEAAWEETRRFRRAVPPV